MYLLDTNVLSALRRRDHTDPKVAAWADSVNPAALYLSTITVLEIELGALALARRDTVQGNILRQWIDRKVLPAFTDRILPVDVAVARQCARLHVPDRRPERDALIAATALAHRLIVVTRNLADFRPMGVQVLDPWLSR